MLKLKLQYFGHIRRRANSLEKILMLGKTEGKRRRGRQRLRWLDSITDLMDMNMNKLQQIVKNREGWHAAVHGVAKSWTGLGDWTTTTTTTICWCPHFRASPGVCITAHGQDTCIHKSSLLPGVSYKLILLICTWLQIGCCADALSCGQLFVTTWTIARQVPLSMEFSRQEHWNGLPFPSPWNRLDSIHIETITQFLVLFL